MNPRGRIPATGITAIAPPVAPIVALTAALSVALSAGIPSAAAQQAPSGGTAARPSPNAPAAPAKPPAATKPKSDSSSPSAGDANVRQRIESLEEQLVDIQVQLGTLESLAKSSGAASASPAYRAGAEPTGASAVDSGRIAGLETQVRTLTAQVQQLTEQVRSLGGQPGRPMREGNLQQPPSGGPYGGAAGSTTTVATAPPGTTPPGWIASPQGVPIGQQRDGVLAGPADVAGSTLPPIPAATGPVGGGDPGAAKAAYEQAYGYLLQQDYGAAEVAFDDFLRAYPNDPLAGNAQFWLGETHFVRGQFKAAASAFLKGYRSYGRSTKAPDSLLKLAMSLGRLGQRDEGCSALNELAAKYPQATADVKNRAAGEKQRAGCP